MSGESSGASSGSTPSLLMPTMESTSSTPSLVLSTSDPPSVTITTSSDMSTTSYESLTDSPVSTTSVTSDSSPPSMSGSSTDATTPATSTDASSYLSSLYPGISSFPPQTSTTIEQAQITSTVPSPPLTGGGVLATSTQISSSGNSFFNDRGTVIGTFVVVAIVSTAMFACLCYAWRRRLQRRNRNQMFNTITWPRDDQRLQAEAGDQPTTSMPSDSTSKPNSDALLHGIRAEGMQTAGISAPATRGTTNEIGPSYYEGLFRDYFARKRKHISRGLTGMAITTNMRPDSPVPSLTPSSPSMYPPSLPPMETESNVTGSTVHSTPFSLPSTSPPPRPPRRRRPPPPPSWKIPETAETPSSLTTPVSFTTLVPPSSSYTLDSISPSSIPDQSRTDSQLRSMTAALVLDRSDHPTRADVRSDRENTFFLKRSLVHGS